ncbi:MAG: sulfite exporter TauE/SafE family protein [Alphaproteobacteria bacterium]|nr:sulfite exporter TauE/SafE family protein [Alphaproteobacteria bacterium]
MEIYLPIAGLPINVFILMFLGLVVGFLSGMFGVGGGFLMTPMLILMGIPPAVAVASEANHILAASVSGFLAHMRRADVDFLMGFILLLGGVLGSIIGVFLLKYLLSIGQEKLFISLSYILILIFVGFWMLAESVSSIKKKNKGKRNKLHEHIWLHGLPFKIKFRKSHLYISVLPPMFIGLLVGILSSIMGIGGGFILVPAMIYILGMPTQVVIGTSLLQIVFVTTVSTIMHSYINQTVDVVLSSLLLIGAVVGAQMGTRAMVLLRGEQIRFLLAIIILIVASVLIGGILVTPDEAFIIETYKDAQ